MDCAIRFALLFAFVNACVYVSNCVRSFFLQIHVSVVGLYPSQQFVIVANIDQDLGVPLDGLPQYAKGSGLEVDVVIVGFGFAVHIVLFEVLFYAFSVPFVL